MREKLPAGHGFYAPGDGLVYGHSQPGDKPGFDMT